MHTYIYIYIYIYIYAWPRSFSSSAHELVEVVTPTSSTRCCTTTVERFHGWKWQRSYRWH